MALETSHDSRPIPDVADAVVIGAGHNGLVAANILADRGWRVVVLEGASQPGGCVRSAPMNTPGFVGDLFSSFYPLAAASPVIAGLQLEEHGLEWSHAPSVLGQPTSGSGIVVGRAIEDTACTLEAHAPGDGEAWRALQRRWSRAEGPLLGALLTPFPPVRAGISLLRRLDIGELGWWARTAAMPVQSFARQHFASEAAAMLLAGNALHADLLPDGAGSALFGLLMTSLAQQHGFPVPTGGAQKLTTALVERLRFRAGTVHTDQTVSEVVVRDGRAMGVITASGQQVRATRAVIADVVAPKLFGTLVSRSLLPERWQQGLNRFEPGWATVKVNWALRHPIPWIDDALRPCGTVHLATSFDEMRRYARQVNDGWIPAQPFLLVGAMTTADQTRSPTGTEAAWAYTHVPQHTFGDAGADGLTGRWTDAELHGFVERIEGRIDAIAPGFRSSIIERHAIGPATMEAMNPNLIAGAINEGTAQLQNELVLRPVPGLGRAETPIRALFLGSASAHPGGGVHGGPGANAARAALAHDRIRSVLRRRPREG